MTMNMWIRAAAVCAAVSGAAQPCLAADASPLGGAPRSGAFAGLYVHAPIGQPGRPRGDGQAGLRLGLSQSGGGARAPITADLARFGFTAGGRPALALAGRSLIDKDGRLSLDQGEEERDGGRVSPWLIAGGVLVLGIGVGALVLADRLECKPHDDEC